MAVAAAHAHARAGHRVAADRVGGAGGDAALDDLRADQRSAGRVRLDLHVQVVGVVPPSVEQITPK
jgi:hypothetical protein